MKIIFKILILSVILSISLVSCDKDNYNANKEHLFRVYTSESDAMLNAMSENIDSLIISVFTPEERERMLIERINNLKPKGIPTEVITQLFNEFRSNYGHSFFEGNPREKDDFSKKFVEGMRNLKSGVCTWPDLGCTSLETCDPRPANITYVQKKSFSGEEIIDHECHRSEGTTDCDNSYYWEAPNWHVYDNPSSYNFHWYCTDVVYRTIMDDNVGGFKDGIPRRFSTFLGNLHELAMNTSWFFYDCPQDEWVQTTRFFVIARASTPRD